MITSLGRLPEKPLPRMRGSAGGVRRVRGLVEIQPRSDLTDEDLSGDEQRFAAFLRSSA